MRPPFSAARTPRAWATAALLAASLSVLAACTTGGSPINVPTVTGTSGAGTTAASEAPSSPPATVAPTADAKPVHIKTANADGATYGVGMPIIAYFTRKITSAAELSQNTAVTANGRPVEGGWYFEYSAAFEGYPIEGHWRPAQPYWPAHSQIHVDMPVQGKSAGAGLVFDNGLTLDFSIGASRIATVDAVAHTLTVVADGRTWGTFPVSLGASNTRTLSGIKVIMEKGLDIPMRGPGYFDPHVKYTQRLTYGGEYLHAAPWNCTGAPGCTGPQNNIGRADSSNGCTNLRPADAKKLYDLLQIGDVVQFPNANGGKMQLGQGYGDWNIPWSQWQTGGLVSTV